ncbi:hypothetical protein [Streptomyces sp. NBC_00827]|uniref:hypothetical protein n=1 Tax=Streptomyces sp. NBC_00827 TaxID=2903677 RepID=UPI00386D6832|nr:hypothetical protein OG569_42245 [Streptomyces sp. NBC_00827]
MTSRRRPDAEQRMRVERTTVLADVLRTMPRDRATVLLARVLYEAPIQLIAERLQVSEKQAERLLGLGLSSMRHPSRAQLLIPVLGDDEDDETLLIDGKMRALIRQWRLEELFAPRCEHCERPYSARAVPIPALWGGIGPQGRPRRYCSDACRQKAYRERRRAAGRSPRGPDDPPESRTSGDVLAPE